MATKRSLTIEQADYVLRLVAEHGSISKAALAANVGRSTMFDWVSVAREMRPGVLPSAARQKDWAKSANLPLPQSVGLRGKVDLDRMTGVKPPLRSDASVDQIASIVREVLRKNVIPQLRQPPAGAPEPTLSPAQSIGEPPAPAPDPASTAWRRMQDRLAQAAAQLRKKDEKIIELEDVVDQLRRCSDVEMPIWQWTNKAPTIAKQSVLVPILFTSDFQTGEVIKADELDGMNEYNSEIFRERYQLMIDKAIDFADHYVGKAQFPGFFYLRGGDAISRGLHPDLAETDDLTTVPACKLVVETEFNGIRKLRSKFKNVRVISIPGNHGRTSEKPRSKGYVDLSYETMLTHWLAAKFENDAGVTFSTPRSGDAYFEVLGHNFLMSHGDRMGSRGGQGYIGPIATISRGHSKLYSNYAMSGRPVDKVLTGHLHTECQTELGFANGSLAGYSQYARDFRARPAAAKQWYFFSHKDHCVAHQFSLKLSAEPRRVEGVEDQDWG